MRYKFKSIYKGTVPEIINMKVNTKDYFLYFLISLKSNSLFKQQEQFIVGIKTSIEIKYMTVIIQRMGESKYNLLFLCGIPSIYGRQIIE